jgi:hypothetical protein
MIITDWRAAGRCAAWLCFAFLLAAWAFPTGVVAQTVSIEPGASWRIGDATVDLDCAALAVAGTLDTQDGRLDGIGHLDITGQMTAATASVEVGGNWSNQGSFLAGTGTVRLSDRCDAGAVSISGTTSFSTLLIESARGKAYRFQAGLSQSVALALRLVGAPGALLPIGSMQAGTQAGLALNPAGQQQIAWVDVSDMAAPEGSAWLAPGRPEDFDSIDSGNNVRWFEPSGVGLLPVSVPATSRWALLALALVLVAFARRGRRFR